MSEREAHADDEEMVSQQDIIEDIKKSNIPEERKPVIVQQMATMHSGPLPDPSAFAGYENTLPGAAERILRMAEAEQAHRFEIENKVLETDSRDSLLGIRLAALITVATVVVGALIILKSSNNGGVAAGVVVGLSGIATTVGMIIKETRSK